MMRRQVEQHAAIVVAQEIAGADDEDVRTLAGGERGRELGAVHVFVVRRRIRARPSARGCRSSRRPSSRTTATCGFDVAAGRIELPELQRRVLARTAIRLMKGKPVERRQLRSVAPPASTRRREMVASGCLVRILSCQLMVFLPWCSDAVNGSPNSSSRRSPQRSGACRMAEAAHGHDLGARRRRRNCR